MRRSISKMIGIWVAMVHLRCVTQTAYSHSNWRTVAEKELAEGLARGEKIIRPAQAQSRGQSPKYEAIIKW